MAPLIQELEDDQPSLANPGQIPTTLQLTSTESKLRDLLLDTAKYIDRATNRGDPIVLRFTGGWVRDKLLGVPSHDIDVGISSMTGLDFGLRLKDFVQLEGNLEKYSLTKRDVGGLHQIKANPEKSKHLETVTTRILGLDVDLVNLRKETYTEDSRNPQMEFGTPEEDALRRDATVNAMFFNINTGEVEDFTGRGRDDMAGKLIRTPLEPYQTFKDDPLRVLRLIRFASRLEYSIDQEAQAAMKNQEIKEALRKKISRERVGIEIEKALRGPHPKAAIELVFGLGLFNVVFSDPMSADDQHYLPDETNWKFVLEHFSKILGGSDPLGDVLVQDDDERYLAWLLMAIVPYRDAPEPEAPAPGKRAPSPIAVQVVREGIKAPTKVCNVVGAAVQNKAEISDLVDRFQRQSRKTVERTDGESVSARDVLGMAIRRWGSTWRSQTMFALMCEVSDAPDKADDLVGQYTRFIAHLQKIGVLEAYNFKPIIDGKALAKAMSTTPGPWMKDALDVVMAYQLRNPDTANVEDAVSQVQDSQRCRGELTSALVSHILRLTIRPLFQLARPTTITNEARKNTTEVLPPRITWETNDEAKLRPWKQDPHALDLLQWAIQKGLDVKILEKEWPLIIPPVLTLLDDWETTYKVLGAQTLTSVLKITPPDLLQRTGLGQVFEDALVHCLAYLPTLTPEEDCISLLSQVYPALYQLSDVLFVDAANDSEINARKIKFLDNILRVGILHGYEMAHQYPSIVALLFTQQRVLLDKMQLDTVRHLKLIIPMLTETLSHSLLRISPHRGPIDKHGESQGQVEEDKSVKALLNSTLSLQTVILNAWPRIHQWRGEISRGLVLCWLKLDEEANGESKASLDASTNTLRRELQETAAILKAAVDSRCDWATEVSLLVEADARLTGLFE